jgi:hypothetical protein
MAQRKKKRARRRGSPYDYVVKIEGRRVVISGKYGGSMRGRGGQRVRFTSDASVPGAGFTMSATAFDRNDAPMARVTTGPFAARLPARPTRVFASRLIRPAAGATMLMYKYTVAVRGYRPADPIIIIEK